MSRFWSKNIHDLTPYTPGEQPQIDKLIKLNTNENPYGPSPKVIAAIKNVANDDLRKYPDPNAQQLKNAIAASYQLKSEQVFVSNSSDEVLAHAFRTFFIGSNKPLLMPDISYGFYPVWCQLFGVDHQPIALDKDFCINIEDYQQDNCGIIFANPNAPTGIALSISEIENLLNANQDSVVIVDEAYVDFAQESAVQLIDQYPNLLVVQTLSKSRSLAGLRVGLACGNSKLIEGLERVKNSFHPYALDQLAIAAASASFEDVDYFQQTRQKVINTREATTRQLSDLGFSVLASQANFLLAKHSAMPAETIFKRLRDNNIIVRYFSLPRINDYIRISIGTDEQMATLISALKSILST